MSGTEKLMTEQALTPTESAPKSLARLNSEVAATDPNRFVNGVIIKGKLFGVENVKKETGDEVCNEALIKLRAIISAKKEHKQPIDLKISIDGLEIIDSKTNTVLYKHLVNRISYISRDVKDARSIGYIYKNSPNDFHYFGIKTSGQAIELFNCLKDLFEVVLEMNTKKKEAAKEVSPAVVEKKPAETPAPTVAKTEPEKKVEEQSVKPAPPVDSLFEISNQAETQIPPLVETKPVQKVTDQLFDMSIEETVVAPEPEKKKDDDWMQMLEAPTPIVSTPIGNIYATNQPLIGTNLLNPTPSLIPATPVQTPVMTTLTPQATGFAMPTPQMNPFGGFSAQQPQQQNQFGLNQSPAMTQIPQANPYAAFTTLQHFQHQQHPQQLPLQQHLHQPQQQQQQQQFQLPKPTTLQQQQQQQQLLQQQKPTSPSKQESQKILNNNLFGENMFSSFNK